MIADSPTYADYIATRQRAERVGSHGLFSSEDEPINIIKLRNELGSLVKRYTFLYTYQKFCIND